MSRLVRFLLIVGGLLAAGVFLVTPDGTGLLQPIDRAFAPVRTVTPIWRLVIVFGSLATCGGAVLIGTVGPVVRRRRRVRPLLAAAVAGLACWLVAVVVERPAPGAVGLAGAGGVDRSFPSLATAVIVAVAVTLCVNRPPQAAVATCWRSSRSAGSSQSAS